MAHARSSSRQARLGCPALLAPSAAPLFLSPHADTAEREHDRGRLRAMGDGRDSIICWALEACRCKSIGPPGAPERENRYQFLTWLRRLFQQRNAGRESLARRQDVARSSDRCRRSTGRRAIRPAQIAEAQHPSVGRAPPSRRSGRPSHRQPARGRPRPAVPPVAPLAQRDQRGERRLPLLRQAILHLSTIIGAGSALQYAVVDQPGEAIGEDVARDAER